MFSVLYAPQFIVLYLFVACGAIVHWRGQKRLRFGRQVFDHSTLLSPYNILMYLFSAVPNRPVLQASEFPELKPLRDNWQTIRDEALALYDGGRIRTAAKPNDWGFHSFFRSGWSRFYLKWYEDFLPSARDMCPQTVSLLNAIPSVHGAMFTMLPAGAKLGAHRDPFAGSLRYHLGLVTPTSPGECRIFVDGSPYTWHDGEDVLFDETYIHYAENTTSDTRIILFCDVERPLRTRFMTDVNRWVCDHIVQQTKTQNVDGEPIGVFNKMFAYIYQVRLVGKRMKAWNSRVYYAVKYSIIGAIFAAVLYSVFA